MNRLEEIKKKLKVNENIFQCLNKFKFYNHLIPEIISKEIFLKISFDFFN